LKILDRLQALWMGQNGVEGCSGKIKQQKQQIRPNMKVNVGGSCEFGDGERGGDDSSLESERMHTTEIIFQS
jgi:hypothetical protein